MKFHCLIPTYRRPFFLEWALKFWERQTLPEEQRTLTVCSMEPVGDLPEGVHYEKPSVHYPPGISNLIANVEKGFRAIYERFIGQGDAREHYIVIWEDDDYYAPGYLAGLAEIAEKNPTAIGYGYTPYFNIVTGRRRFNNHPLRSSFCCTAVRADILAGTWLAEPTFKFSSGCRYPDVELWQHLQTLSPTLVYPHVVDWQIDFPVIGVKHGEGAVLGIGHRPAYCNDRSVGWDWFESLVDADYFEWARGREGKLFK